VSDLSADAEARRQRRRLEIVVFYVFTPVSVWFILRGPDDGSSGTIASWLPIAGSLGISAWAAVLQRRHGRRSLSAGDGKRLMMIGSVLAIVGAAAIALGAFEVAGLSPFGGGVVVLLGIGAVVGGRRLL
jgi:hypothetical protein